MRPVLITLATAAILAVTSLGVNAGKPKLEQPFTAEQINAHLDQIVFPAVKFENTPIREVVRILVMSSRQYDRTRKGIDILLQQPPMAVDPSTGKVAVAGQQMACKINFAAGATPLRLLLDEICRQCEFEWTAADMMGKSSWGKDTFIHNIIVQISPRQLTEDKLPAPPEKKPRK
jgi:hypothetical protein